MNFSLLEKRVFVPIRNSHFYRVLNQYKASGTNVVEPRPGTNVPPPLRRGMGAFVPGGGTTRYK
jgi:hypothetical protein